MAHYENLMLHDRVHIKTDRGMVIKPRSADYTGEWKPVTEGTIGMHYRLSLARKRTALELATKK
jgi:hypothetical protein